jgi:hypothetical protein
MELAKEGGILALTGLAPSGQTVVSLFRVIHEQAKRSSWMTKANRNFRSNWYLLLKKEFAIFKENSFSLKNFIAHLLFFIKIAFVQIFDDTWLPDLAKFYQIHGGYYSSQGVPDNEFRFSYWYYFYTTFSTLTFNQSACASLH